MSLVARFWSESRLRFGIAALALLAVRLAGPAEPDDSAKTLFILLTIVLAGGSLRHERALGTLLFTLALPVSRARLFAARAGAGVVQIALLAALVGRPLVWSVCGLLFFAVATLFAVAIASEIVAWLGAFFVLMGYESLVNLTSLAEQPLCDLYRVMSLPASAVALAVIAAASALLLLVAAAVERRVTA